MTHETKLGVLVSCSFLGLLGYLVVVKNREVPAIPDKDKPKAVAEAAPPSKHPAARAPEHVEKEDHTPTTKPEIIAATYQTPMSAPLPPSNPPPTSNPPGNMTFRDLPVIPNGLVVPDPPAASAGPPAPTNINPPSEVRPGQHEEGHEQAKAPPSAVKPEQVKALAFLGFGTPAPGIDPTTVPVFVGPPPLPAVTPPPEQARIAIEPPATPPGALVAENRTPITIIRPPNNSPTIINPPMAPPITPLLEVPTPGNMQVPEPRVSPANPPMSPPSPPQPEIKVDLPLSAIPPPPPGIPMTPPAIVPMPSSNPGIGAIPDRNPQPLEKAGNPVEAIPTRPVGGDLSGQAPSGNTIKPIRGTEVAAPIFKPEQSNPTPLPPSLSSSDPPRVPSVPMTPALGAPTADGSGRPVGQGNAQVRSFTEKIYTWKAGDSFDKLSQDNYYTKNLAGALKKYNQDHPMATDNQRNHGDPAPGERIYLPPAAQLERADQTSKPLSPLPTGSSANAAPGTLPTYKVTQDNTYIVNVALDTLKKGERWVELHQLNPQINPEIPLPIGTIVRLPADAVVSAGH